MTMADTYEIVNSTPRVVSIGGGQFATIVTVTFKTKPGAQLGTVDVPETAFSVDEVDKLVRQKAAILEAVKNL
jgi:hypothetical protein